MVDLLLILHVYVVVNN